MLSNHMHANGRVTTHATPPKHAESQRLFAKIISCIARFAPSPPKKIVKPSNLTRCDQEEKQWRQEKTLSPTSAPLAHPAVRRGARPASLRHAFYRAKRDARGPH
jgi:hypothetical protein